MEFESPVDFNDSQTGRDPWSVRASFESPVDFNDSQTMHILWDVIDSLRAL